MSIEYHITFLFGCRCNVCTNVCMHGLDVMYVWMYQCIMSVCKEWEKQAEEEGSTRLTHFQLTSFTPLVLVVFYWLDFKGTYNLLCGVKYGSAKIIEFGPPSGTLGFV